MWRKIALLAATIPVFAGAMTEADAAGPVRSCRVLASEKLGAGSGGAAALCAEVKRAVEVAVPDAPYRIEVQVLSPARLAATGTVRGRSFPQQNLASSDRDLTPGAIRRFARTIGEAAKAVR